MSPPYIPPASQPRALVIGAGPAGLAAAEVLAQAGAAVTVCDAMPSPGRKFLMAGRGGLNLTHSEPLEAFLDRYGENRHRLEPAIRAFPPEALRQWAADLGVETFVGASGRVFPVGLKASPLLRAWLRRLAGMGVGLRTRMRWTGWSGDALTFETPDGAEQLSCETAVFALGGASWPRLGSDGGWAPAFAAHGVALTPFRPSNSGFHVAWSEVFRTAHAGQPLKSARFAFAGQSVRSEAMITDRGIEGGAIYSLSAALRDAVERDGKASLVIDLAPDLTADALAKRLAPRPSQSMGNRLRKAGLSPAAASLLRERVEGPALPQDPSSLTSLIKACPIPIGASFPIDRAISSAGGVRWEALNSDFSLKADPRIFVCGEMLDWEAPTGGYLLQACFATGRVAGLGAVARCRQ